MTRAGIVIPMFCKRVPRWAVILAAVALLVALPPEVWGRGPDFCLWKHLFHIAACPACGSTRALAAFFHGRFHQALAYNRNVIVTGPLLLGLLIRDLRKKGHGIQDAGTGACKGERKG